MGEPQNGHISVKVSTRVPTGLARARNLPDPRPRAPALATVPAAPHRRPPRARAPLHCARFERLPQVSKEKLERQVMAYDYALKQLDEEAATIEDGTHPELVARVKVLDDTRDARARAPRPARRDLPRRSNGARAAPSPNCPPEPRLPAQIARATRDYEAELATLDRLHDHEIEVSGRAGKE